MSTYYKWTLEEDYVLDLNKVWEGKYTLPNADHPYLKIKDNVITIPESYSWDGCTPKRKMFGLIIGTWDGPENPETGKQWCYYGSLVHDALYQYHIQTRKTADKLFWELLKGFKLRNLYYRSVRICGWMLF